MIKHGSNAIWEPLLQAIRKLVLGFILVFGYNYPNFQLMAVNFAGVFQLIVTGWLKPYKSSGTNKNCLVNEIYVLFAYYHLACTTAFVSDPDARTYVGWSMILFTCLNMLVSLSQLLRLNWTKVKKKWRKRAQK